MECNTIVTYDGIESVKTKFRHKTKKSANKFADKSNRKRTAIWLSVVYKCSECGFFHVGKDKTQRVRKEDIRKPQKIKKEIIEYVSKTELKIIGRIELPSSKIKNIK